MEGNFKVTFYKGSIITSETVPQEIMCDKVDPVFNSSMLSMSNVSGDVVSVLAVIPMHNIVSIESTSYLQSLNS